MVGAPERSRVYIVYQHSLFAEGIRSLLRDQPAVRIVGAERDKTQAFKDVKALKPSVVLVEEAAGDPLHSTAWDFLHGRAAARVISLNLDQSSATVYDQESLPMSTPGDLLDAVRGYPRGPMPGEATTRPGRGTHASAEAKAKGSIPEGKTVTRKGRA